MQRDSCRLKCKLASLHVELSFQLLGSLVLQNIWSFFYGSSAPGLSHSTAQHGKQVLHLCLSSVLSLHPAILTYLLFLMCPYCSMQYALYLLFLFPRMPFCIFYLWPPIFPHSHSSWFSGFTSYQNLIFPLPQNLSWCLLLMDDQIVHPIFYLSAHQIVVFQG